MFRLLAKRALEQNKNRILHNTRQKSSAALAALSNGSITELPYAAPDIATTPIDVPEKILMGPGPTSCARRVLAAGSQPLLGHMHPEFWDIMDECKEWLRYVMQTDNQMTIPISGTGHAAMEAAVANIIEPGDIIVVGINGLWGQVVAEMSARYGADVRPIKVPEGGAFSQEAIANAMEENKGAKVLFLTHGESTTGVLQPLDGVSDICRKHGALLFLDTVCTLGGVPLSLDTQGVDVCYSGAQKCLGAPPGASPISLSPLARQKIANRKTKVASWYFDLDPVGKYWGVDGQSRIYHHTALISNIYMFREALAMIAEEGLENTWARHREMAEELWSGLRAMGLELFVEDDNLRLPTVTTIKIPQGIEGLENGVTSYMMKHDRVEMWGGLGPTKGKVWRIGTMGENARPEKVKMVLGVLREALIKNGFKPKN